MTPIPNRNQNVNAMSVAMIRTLVVACVLQATCVEAVVISGRT
jgi:hypothetical protein